MKVLVERQKIFKTEKEAGYKISTDPKVVRFKRYYDQEAKQHLTVYDIEFYCIVDQRAILESDISRIEVYVAQNNLSNYDAPIQSPYSSISAGDVNSYNNVTFDIVNIMDGESIKKFDDHVFLTELEPQQNFNKFPARRSNIHKLTDDQAFGTVTKYEVVPSPPPRLLERRGISKTGDKYIDFFRNSDLFKPASESEESESSSSKSRSAFQRNYRKLIMQGIDPMSIFQRPDRGQGMTEFLKGVKTIDKDINHNHVLRKISKNIISAESDSGFNSPVSVKKVKFTNRIARLKTRMRMTSTELFTLKDTGKNLIVYAVDRKNNKIDSTEYTFDIDEMLADLNKKRPPYKFDAVSSRNRAGFVVSSIQNHERRVTNVNVYSKKVLNGVSITQSTFELTDGSVILRPKQRRIIMDGNDSKPTTFGSSFGTRTPVFHRYTSDFRGREISNSKSSYVGPFRSYNNPPSCSIYAIISRDRNERSMLVKVTNITSDTMKVRVLKRVATNSERGQNFERLKGLNGLRHADIFLNPNDHSLTSTYTFVDGDVEDGVTYEYVAELTNRSGYTTRVGNTFREVYEDPSDSVVTIVLDSESSGGTESPENERALDGSISFKPTILIKTKTTDVDKLLNSVFDEKHDLFLDEFKNIKDTSNLVFGARVHRINKTLGVIEYVGSFTAKKTKAKDEAFEGKTQDHFVTFRDEVSPFYRYAYKIEPYVLPPSQVLDRVSDLIKNITRKTFNKSLSIGKYQTSALKIKTNSSAAKKVSSIGSKYGSVRTKKGRLSENKTLLERTGDDLFADGFTGDIIYHDLETSVSDFFSNVDVIKSAEIKKTTFYSRRKPSNRNRIRKSIVEIIMNVDGDDRLTDFYVILRRENTQKNMLIDGVIHSTDDPQPSKSYVYMSKCRGSVGAIEYFALPIFKNGMAGKVEPLGIYIAED